MLSFRLATKSDLPELIKLLNDDDIAKQRESLDGNDFEFYQHAFNNITQDPNAMLIVAEYQGNIIATAQLNFLTYLSHLGSTRAQVENVRVASHYRGQGIGRQLFTYLIQCAKERDCYMMQLTSNQARHDAIRFYESLNFVRSHAGMKLILAH